MVADPLSLVREKVGADDDGAFSNQVKGGSAKISPGWRWPAIDGKQARASQEGNSKHS